ncbi:MAG: hypothetical protein J6I42_10285, partial [Clostridia bacterium]|nr:hypothetical protein [Clostridia bacterium]
EVALLFLIVFIPPRQRAKQISTILHGILSFSPLHHISCTTRLHRLKVFEGVWGNFFQKVSPRITHPTKHCNQKSADSEKSALS